FVRGKEVYPRFCHFSSVEPEFVQSLSLFHENRPPNTAAWLSIDPDCLVEENRRVPSGQIGDAPCRLIVMSRTVVVDVADATSADAGVSDDEPRAAWSRWWKCGIEGRFQVSKVPSPDSVAVRIRKLKTPPKKEPSARTQCDCSSTTGPKKVASPAPTTSS